MPQPDQSQIKARCSFCLLVFLLALGVRLGYMAAFHGPTLSLDAKLLFLPLSRHILNGEGYTRNGKEPYVKREPLYPAYLAGVFYFFPRNLTLVKLLQSILGGILCIIVYMLGLRLASVRAAKLAALGCALYPPLIYINVDIAAETLACLFLAAGLYLLVLGLENNRAGFAFAAGAAWALATLARQTSLLLPFFLLLGLVWRRRFWRISGPLVVGFCLTLAPWTARNYSVSKRIIPVATNSGQALYHGSRPEFIVSGLEHYLVLGQDMARFNLSGKSGAEINRILGRAALVNLWQLLTSDPVGFILFMGRKFFRLWYSTTSGIWEWQLMLINGGLLGLAAGGVWALRPAKPSLQAMYLIIAFFILLHTVAFPLNRYMVHIMPYIILLASQGALALHEGLTRHA